MKSYQINKMVTFQTREINKLLKSKYSDLKKASTQFLAYYPIVLASRRKSNGWDAGQAQRLLPERRCSHDK